MLDIVVTAPVSQLFKGLRGRCLDEHRATTFVHGRQGSSFHAKASWLKAEAARNISSISKTAPVAHSPIGLRGCFLDGRRAQRRAATLLTGVEETSPARTRAG